VLHQILSTSWRSCAKKWKKIFAKKKVRKRARAEGAAELVCPRLPLAAFRAGRSRVQERGVPDLLFRAAARQVLLFAVVFEAGVRPFHAPRVRGKIVVGIEAEDRYIIGFSRLFFAIMCVLIIIRF